MKTLVLLSALVLLAFQVQADHIQEAEEETKTEEQPADEDQDMSVSFEGPEASALQNLEIGWPLKQCHCRKFCRPYEKAEGSCRPGLFIKRKICCIQQWTPGRT
ncbi:alpha-defensin 8 precursor [Rattus norvegicus]|uniref:Defensin alpha 8 n=1 Tax=Rattus norvegicus TaxID=10116 RepID=Q4JEI6_RAT|nr:alpha-defensin 8 precursor [Rattus norvegicus]AAT68751.1 defensin alpha 8 [Rattus norvegicus]AAT68759.1 defensin alpha 8 [Rattus norvegicus]|eukprot:NP_001028249.1 alpha-defensin 8 precursor [Rattus norvegicus]